MLYHRMVMEPHTAYPIPAGTRYILLTVQKTLFGLDIIPEMILPQLMENGFNLGDFRKMKRFDQKAYKLPPPTPAHVPAETNKRPLEQQPGPSSKNRVFITPVIRPPVLIARPSTALSTPQPVSIPDPPELTTAQIPDPPAPIPPELTTPQILLPDPPMQTTPPQPPELMIPQILLPDPPVQTTPQILLPDPPPVVETLEPTLMDASSIDQIVSSVLETARTCRWRVPKNPRCWTRYLPCLTRVMISSRSWIILKQVWEAYQPQTTDAYSVDFTDCPRVADVYVKWLTWLDDWEMHRDDNVPCRMVGLQPWKRALEKHVQRSHEKALANGMPSDVTLLEHI
ncbi:uncharacterized protein TNCV_3044591 [Trichonephila clavipes]|nr:uncharacterized protein TNCV_3044591 [Trichonephila clavipes]